MSGFRDYRFSLQINEEIEVTVPESYFIRCYGSDGLITVIPEGQTNFTMQNGIAITTDEKFDRFRLINNHDNTNVVEIYVGAGRVDDNRLISSGAVSSQDIGSQRATRGFTDVGFGATHIFTADPKRKSVLIHNVGPSTVYFTTGGTIGDASQYGMPITVGGFATVTIAQQFICSTAQIAGEASRIKFIEEFSE